MRLQKPLLLSSSLVYASCSATSSAPVTFLAIPLTISPDWRGSGCCSILCLWTWLLRQNLGDLPKMSGLMAVYEEHRGHLAPLMYRIERTDWLIDQVMYQLYGLSKEEIAVVEEGR